MTEEQKRENIAKARNFNKRGTFESHVLSLLCMQMSLLADISETLLDMQKGEEHENR